MMYKKDEDAGEIVLIYGCILSVFAVLFLILVDFTAYNKAPAPPQTPPMPLPLPIPEVQPSRPTLSIMNSDIMMV